MKTSDIGTSSSTMSHKTPLLEYIPGHAGYLTIVGLLNRSNFLKVKREDDRHCRCELELCGSENAAAASGRVENVQSQVALVAAAWSLALGLSRNSVRYWH
jgi:hypothetical protein